MWILCGINIFFDWVVKMSDFVKLCEIEIIQQHHANDIRKMLENTGFLMLRCNLMSGRSTYEIWFKNPIK